MIHPDRPNLKFAFYSNKHRNEKLLCALYLSPDLCFEARTYRSIIVKNSLTGYSSVNYVIRQSYTLFWEWQLFST